MLGKWTQSKTARLMRAALFTGVIASSGSLVLTPSAAEETSTPDAATAQKAKAAIDRVRAAFEKAAAAGDMEVLKSLLHEGAIMVGPGARAHQKMKEAAKDAPFPPGYRIKITPIELHIMNNEWAYEFGTAVRSYLPEGAGERVKVHDTYLILIRNDGTGWKPFREVASASPPPGGWPTE